MMSETIAPRFSRKKLSQSHQRVSVPCSIIFINRPECVLACCANGKCNTCSTYSLNTVCRLWCASRSENKAMPVEPAIVKRPKPIHIMRRGATESQVAVKEALGVRVKTSMTLPNKIGSAKSAHAITIFANASNQPRRWSGPSNFSAR